MKIELHYDGECFAPAPSTGLAVARKGAVAVITIEADSMPDVLSVERMAVALRVFVLQKGFPPAAE